MEENFAKAIGHIFVLDQGNGKERLIFDARPCNRLMYVDKFTLPAATELLEEPFKHVFKVDLTDAFMHFPASERLQQH